jgi:3D (Asp-Asp-Asp) domain-containing protein
MNTYKITLLLLLSPLVIRTADTKNTVIYPVKISKLISYHTVTLTTYSPTVGETDSTPHLTASGFKIDTLNPIKHRIIAVSRDLKKKWKFGTRVKIKNAGKYNGIYTVKDVMNKRFKNHIDLLIGEDDKHTTIKNVKIIKI